MISGAPKKEPPRLLAIMELGGYPNLTPLYRRLGFDTEVVNSQRKAQSYLKKRIPDVIVAEYNFQSDFRDRTSNLETLMARLQRYPEVRVIVFFQSEFRHKFDDLVARFPIFEAIHFPIEPARVEAALRRALSAAK
jgi:DNA-binding NtrC family response regulator